MKRVGFVATKAECQTRCPQVLLHYEAFQQEGARVTYKEFDFGHLDFTFAVRHPVSKLQKKVECSLAFSLATALRQVL